LQPEAIAVFDGHNDALQHIGELHPGGRDFLLRSSRGHLDLPRAREGGLFGGLFAMFARSPMARGELMVTPDGYEVRLAAPLDPAAARLQIEAQRDALARLLARADGQMRLALSRADIEAAQADGAFALVLHLEGADAIDTDLAYLRTLHAAGLRSLGLVWSRPNAFGHGVPFAYPRSPDTGPGLTPAGRELVQACNRLGIMVDLAHLNERGFWDVAALTTAPLVVTHACAHAVCPSARNLTDRQLDAVAESGGVVGFNFCVNDIRPDARQEVDTPMAMILDHLVYLIERVGIEHVAFGSDFDGAPIPRPIGDASGLPRLVEALRERGFDDEALRRIAHGNWLRVLDRAWRAGASS